MRGKFRFTTITGDDDRVVVIHSRSVTYLESYDSGAGGEVVRIVLNSGHSIYASGSLEDVMTELYGRSLKGQRPNFTGLQLAFFGSFFGNKFDAFRHQLHDLRQH